MMVSPVTTKSEPLHIQEFPTVEAETAVALVAPVALVALSRKRREPVTLALCETAHDEVIGVVEHVANLIARNRSVEHDRVPVLLVHVVAGAHAVESCAQLFGSLRIALQID